MSKNNINETALILQSLQAIKSDAVIVSKKTEAIPKKSMVTDMATKTAAIGFEKNNENHIETQETKMVKKSRHKELMSA